MLQNATLSLLVVFCIFYLGQLTTMNKSHKYANKIEHKLDGNTCQSKFMNLDTNVNITGDLFFYFMKPALFQLISISIEECCDRSNLVFT